MSKAPNEIETFQIWYASQCDGVWEHQFGVSITTLDNPGWAVEVDLGPRMNATPSFREIKEVRTDSDWIFCRVKEREFSGHGGPLNLEEILAVFNNFARDFL